MNNSWPSQSTDALSYVQTYNRFILFGLLGVCLGCLDQYASRSSWIDFDTTIEFWLVVVTISAISSKSRLEAASRSTVLLISTVLAYYVMYYMNLGFLPAQYLGTWLIIALVASVYSYVIWGAGQRGRAAALLGSVPTAYLIKQGDSFLPDLFFNPEAAQLRIHYFGLDVYSGFNLLAAIALYAIMINTTRCWLTLTIATVTGWIILRETSILSFLPF